MLKRSTNLEKNPTWLCVVAAALSDGEGRWLMQRRPENKFHGGLWEFPGGKVEAVETPANALIREIAEELGVIIEPAALEPAGFAADESNAARPPIVILLYRAGEWHGEPRALEPGASVGWFTSAEIAGLARPPLDVVLARQLFGDRTE